MSEPTRLAELLAIRALDTTSDGVATFLDGRAILTMEDYETLKRAAQSYGRLVIAEEGPPFPSVAEPTRSGAPPWQSA